MHRLVMILVVSVVVCGVVWAQGGRSSFGGYDLSHANYTVQVVEFRLNTEPGHVLTPEEIVRRYQRLRSAGTLDVIGTLNGITMMGMSALMSRQGEEEWAYRSIDDDAESGLTITLASGSRAEIRVMESDGKHAVSIDYSSTVWIGTEKSEGKPDLSRLTLQATRLITLGQPALIGGTDAAGGRYVVVTVTE